MFVIGASIDVDEESAILVVQPNEEVITQGHNSWWNVSAKVSYILISLLRLFSLIVFSGYDQRCVIFDRASILNCTQEFLVPRPERWVLVWMIISIISSTFLILIIRFNQEQLNYSFVSLKGLWKKGSFWSLNVLFCITFIFYCIRFDNENEMTKAMSLFILIRLPVTLFVVYCLNYLPRVRFPCRNDRDLGAVGNCFVYWITLVVCCAENACLVVSATLDAVLKVAPLIEGNYHDTAIEMHGFVLILLGVNVAFETRLLAFFWYKIFHGGQDLFLEPSRKLVEEMRVGNNTGQAKIPPEGVSTEEIPPEGVSTEEIPLQEGVLTEEPPLEGVSTEEIPP